MPNITELSDLMDYPFDNHLASDMQPSFLIRSMRMGCNRCEPDFQILRNREYPYFTLHLLFSGCSFFHIAGSDFLLNKGDAFIITAGEAHSYKNMRDSELGFLWIELSGDSCRDLLRYFSLRNIHTLSSDHTQKIAGQLIQIMRYVKSNNTPNEFELSAMYYTLIMYLLEAATASPGRQVPRLLSDSREYIDRHFTEEIQIRDIAEHLHVSHTYLTRIFRQYFGTPPIRYLTMKRIEYACSLLENTELRCEAIAEMTGFYDGAHLHKAFLHSLGISPSGYRRQVYAGTEPSPSAL